jgi:hypothetical protein
LAAREKGDGSFVQRTLGAAVFLIAALDNPFRGGVTIDPALILYHYFGSLGSTRSSMGFSQ